MQGQASAYAALGLPPDAGREEVERAYRRLIKLHHPDLQGGDGDRAAEINRAYAELRRTNGEPPMPATHSPRPPQPRRPHGPRRVRRFALPIRSFLTLGVCCLMLLQAEPLSEDLALGWRAFERAFEPVVVASGQRGGVPGAIEDPLSEGEIADAVRQAARLSRPGLGDEVTQYSRSCHRELRATPSVAALDRCVAFDIAVAALADRDPIRDGGRFGASELAARQMNSASLLSTDYLAIERRLDRVRNAVEIRLRAPLPETPPPPPMLHSDPEALPPVG